MEIKPLFIGDLKAKIPLIQGGMGVGISRWRLASAIAKEGGIGIISTAQIGYDEGEFKTNPIETNLKAIKKHLSLAKEAAKDGIVGVNIMVCTKEYPRYVKAACEAKAQVIISGAGLPISLPQLVEGYDVKIAPIVSSKKAAEVILRMWDRKYSKTADFVVIEGPGAGGHLGFTKEELILGEEFPFQNQVKEILALIKNYEKKYKRKIPLILGGGIYDREDIIKALELGVDGVQISTRFVVTKECDASQAYKQAYIDAKQEDVKIVLSPVGMPGRAIENQFLKRISQEKVPVEKCYQCLEGCNPKEIPYCITKALINAVEGNIDEGLIFAGEKVYKLKEMTTVKDLIRELFH